FKISIHNDIAIGIIHKPDLEYIARKFGIEQFLCKSLPCNIYIKAYGPEVPLLEKPSDIEILEHNVADIRRIVDVVDVAHRKCRSDISKCSSHKEVGIHFSCRYFGSAS